jgi:hypothetical protein
MLQCTRTVQVVAVFTVLLPFGARGLVQDPNSLAPSSQEQWKVFVDETLSPLLPSATFFNATTSELTRSVPHYGGEPISYVKRFVASAADDTAQNFFSDYVMASLLREDTRYRRLGPNHAFFARVGMRPPPVWWRTSFPAIAQSTGQTLRDRPSAPQYRTLTIPQSTARSAQLLATSRRTSLGQAWEISRRSSGRIFAIG